MANYWRKTSIPLPRLPTYPNNFHFGSSHFLRLLSSTSEGLVAFLAPEIIQNGYVLTYSFESKFKATDNYVLTNIWGENVPLCTHQLSYYHLMYTYIHIFSNLLKFGDFFRLMWSYVRKVVIEGMACQLPSSLRRLQATPLLQTSLGHCTISHE